MASTSDLHSVPTWDVFLSFRGEDTRRNFTDHLYSALDRAGILVFRDDIELQRGADISSGLLKAIKNTKKFVVVISENYASSSWCLDELAEILGCKKTKTQIIPVFYHVNPSDVRHLKASFREALKHHEKRYSADKINKWKSALFEIAGLSGHHLGQDAENEWDTIQKIVKNVAPQAFTETLHQEKYLVGTDYAIEKIYEELNLESHDVRICGIGGMWKTTTAKAFYNKYSSKFDLACYIPIVKQNSRGGSPLLPSLEQLLIELLRRKDYKVRDVESGIRKLKHIFRSKTALIVLDNLNQSCYLELVVGLSKLLSGGSRIMVTTTDVNLLNRLKVDTHKGITLPKYESLKFFNAFRKLAPPESFRELFVCYAGGLPLALKLSGSYLRDRTHVSFWKSKLEKLQKVPEKEIHKKFQRAYDDLDDDIEMPIFLDIAFFFVGKDEDEAVHIIKSRGNYSPDSGKIILVKRCLLTIDDNSKFQMHNLKLDMGRKLEQTWDVFLSFYGKDTRRNFIEDLYFNLDKAGIQTFKDDFALKKGEEIYSGLRKAIMNAKKFIVVISENYARSSWCLDELLEILGCKQTKDQVILVFYYVNPTDVHHQKGSFGEALEAHKERYSVNMINEWRSALSEIAKLSGYHYYLLKQDADDNESDTIQKILEDVTPQAPTKAVQL